MLALLLVLACKTEAPPPPPPPAPVEAPKPKDTPQSLLAAGKFPEAITLAQGNLATNANDPAAWESLELAAIRSGKAAQVVDSLAADKAIGDQTQPHFMLRGSLALVAKRPADALSAAAALQTTAPGDAAYLIAAAVLQGATAPASTDPALSALLAWVTDAKKPLDPAADNLLSWRLSILKGQIKLSRGDNAGALAEADKAAGSGSLAQQQAALLKIAASNAEDTWTLLDSSVKAGGDPWFISEQLNAGSDKVLSTWRADALASIADDAKKLATKDKNESAAAQIAVVQAKALNRGGQPQAALDLLNGVTTVESAKAAIAWQMVFVEGSLGEADKVEEAAASLEEPRKSAALDLARAMRGEAVSLPSVGLQGSEAAMQALLGAGWQSNPHPARAAALVAAKDDPDLLIWASLVQDRHKLALNETPAAKAEATIRNFLGGGNAGALEDESHPDAAGWKAILQKAPVVASGGGVNAWARARAALASGDMAAATREYGTVAIAVPAWRTGPWEPLLALEGPTPDEMNAIEGGLMKGATDPLSLTVLMHGWNHRIAAAHAAWHVGVTPMAGSTLLDQRRAVWDAVAAHRTATILWIAGKGPAPQETAKRLTSAEEAAKLSNFQPPSLTALRANLPRTGLLSMRQMGANVEMLVLTETDGRIVMVNSKTVDDVRALLQNLPLGKAQAIGNRVRTQIIDPQMNLLLGIGRYFVVGDGVMGALPLTALPEQEDAQRYLMEIRSVGHYSTFDQLIPNADIPGDFSVDMLALCGSPAEADAMRRVFPNGIYLSGKDATLAAWRENAHKARFIHIGNLPTAPNGGFRLSDGVLHLSEIGATALSATAAYVHAEDGPTAVTRGLVLRKAGVAEVLAQGWGSNANFNNTLMGYWWELESGRGAVGRALAEARPRALKEGDENIRREPEVWGGFFVLGRF